MIMGLWGPCWWARGLVWAGLELMSRQGWGILRGTGGNPGIQPLKAKKLQVSGGCEGAPHHRQCPRAKPGSLKVIPTLGSCSGAHRFSFPICAREMRGNCW